MTDWDLISQWELRQRRHTLISGNVHLARHQMACPQSARKNILCRRFKPGPPRLQTYNPCHQRGIRVVSTSEGWNGMHGQIFHCVKVCRHILIIFYSKGMLTRKNGERWWSFTHQEKCMLDREQFCLPTSAERYSDARQPQHLHQNASFWRFSFTCSSLIKVQQKFPHVKGWAVKKFTRVMFHKERPVTQHWTGQAYSTFS